MQVTICERGCGRTSTDPNADIQSVSVTMRADGASDDDSVFKARVEVCAKCRQDIKNDVEGLFRVAKFTIRIEKDSVKDSKI